MVVTVREQKMNLQVADILLVKMKLPQMNPQQKQKMLDFCHEYHLFASMGSDFHYPSKWSDLGRNLTMPIGAKPIWAQWQ